MTMMLSRSITRTSAAAVATKQSFRWATARRKFADVADLAPPLIRKKVSLEERAALRAARKARASQVLGGTEAKGASSSTNRMTAMPVRFGWWVWGLGLAVPTGLFAWAYTDETSPPARFFEMVGLTAFIKQYTDPIMLPVHEKLLPDWNQMPNVPLDIPVPHTLVLDLEETLVSATWDRGFGWRYAKRPGVDKFLHTMAQYYEIVLCTPSYDAVADPVVTSLDKSGCIMHRLYRESMHFKNGTYVKDLNKFNRNVNRIVVLDDDPEAVQFHPDNLIHVKAYDDPMNRTDNTLERITPFLIEIARKGHSDVPSILRQYRGMDADQIADEYQRRVDNLRTSRLRNPSLLGGFANRGGEAALPPPEMTPVMDADSSGTQQLTAKDLVGAAPPSESSGGMVQWMNRRAKEKEEEHMRKMEKWNEIMIKKQQAKRDAAGSN